MVRFTFQKRRHIFAALAVVDQLTSMGYLLQREFRLASELHAWAFRGLHSGAGPFAYQAALKLGQYAYHLPHRAARSRVGVDCLGERRLCLSGHQAWL